MCREDNTEINFQMIDKDTHECRVLLAINQSIHIDVDDISKITGIVKSSVNTAIRSLLKKQKLCGISFTEGGPAKTKECAVKYRLVKMYMKVSDYTVLSNKEKGKPKVKKIKRYFIRELSSQAMGDIGFLSRANGYSVGGVCHG